MIMTGEVYTLTLDTVYFLKTVKKVTVQAMHNLTVATLKKAIADRKSFIYQEDTGNRKVIKGVKALLV